MVEALAQSLRAAIPDAVLDTQRGGQELVLHAGRAGLPALMLTLRDGAGLEFQQCMDICGVDWPERAERFDVVYNLLSLSLNHRLRIVVPAAGDTPVPSVADIWPSATWFERECWDMYGVVFEGLSDLRRLLTDYGFEGHPLRKDFPLSGHVELRYDEERKQVVYEPVSLTQDFRNFDFLSPWEAMTTLPGDEKVHLNRVGGPALGQSEGPKPPAGGVKQ